MAALTVAVMVWAYINMNPASNPPPAVERPQTIQPITASATSAPTADRLNIQEKSNAPWGRDPFRAATVRAVPRTDRPQQVQSDWKLSGILYNSSSAIAIINGKSARTGDTIDNARVVQIDKNTVTLEKNGKRFTITVAKG